MPLRPFNGTLRASPLRGAPESGMHPMQTRIRFAALVIAVATSALGCSAQADQTTDKIKSALQTRLGIDASDIKGITKAPMPGLYEINLGTQIVYSDASGDYVLNGELIDTKAHR